MKHLQIIKYGIHCERTTFALNCNSDRTLYVPIDYVRKGTPRKINLGGGVGKKGKKPTRGLVGKLNKK